MRPITRLRYWWWRIRYFHDIRQRRLIEEAQQFRFIEWARQQAPEIPAEDWDAAQAMMAQDLSRKPAHG